MSDGGCAEEPVPGLDTGPDAEPGPLVRTIEVDGQVFAVRRGHGGGTDYDWTNGPNEGYGFGSTVSPDLPEDQHRDGIRGFLAMIDPATGFIAD